MKIYCICGKAQNGKDTTALMMKEIIENTTDNKVLITHYADVLKYVCRTFFGWDGNKDEKGRTLLQYVATEKVRNIDPDFWVDFIGRLMAVFSNEWDYVLIADTRFENEIKTLKKYGLDDITVLRVVRDNFDNGLTEEQKNHLSEIALDNYRPDILLHNDSTLDGLKLKIEEILRKENEVHLWKHQNHTLEL